MRRTYRRPKPKISKMIYRINEHIRVPEVRLIDAEDNNIGVVATARALEMAREQELDLIEVSPKAQPPVARIGDYGRIKYQTEKIMQKQKVHQKKIEVKSVRLSLRISPHDRELRMNQAVKFLGKGSKLKVDIVLKGRERQLRNKAQEVMMSFVDELKAREDLTVAEEQALTKQPSGFNIVLINKRG